jgi:hypothetical protein
MASQTFIFVALPNGLGANNKLKLSLYLTPRLDKGATLAAFPDMLSWPQSIQEHGLKFQIACGANNVTVSADTNVLRPDIWQTIFAPDTFVEAYKFPNYASGLFVSYPSRQALAFLKYAYQFVGIPGSSKDEREGALRVLGPLSFRNGTKSNLARHMAEVRVEMWNQQQVFANAGGAAGAGAALAPTNNPDGVPTTLEAPNTAATHDMATRFALFHDIPKAPNRPSLPSTPTGFKKTLDFHKALTALNSYPALLRALGLVFDLEVPASLCPTSPSAGAYGTISVGKVTPGFKWQLTPKFSLTATSYWRDSNSFCAAPAASPAAQSAGNYPPSDVFKGFLAMSPQNFFLSQVDLDGALQKALGLADNVQNLVNTDNIAAIDQTLPSLRSAGISLMADGRGLQLLRSILNNQAFNNSISSNGNPPYNAQDLVRGYRIDIWSSRTNSWHSLHSRTATYRFGTNNQIVLKQGDEGFTQLAAAQAADDPTRKPDQFSIDHDIPQPAQNVYVHERVARWNGWSLSVARPVKPLNRSADPGKALDSDPTLDTPMTPFKMISSFQVTSGSLPELRFGANYRLRARSVDLAGNSVPVATSVSNAFAAPANGIQMKYLRFEPIAQPLLVLRQTPAAGATLARLAIRSYNGNVSLDSQVTSETDQRHVAPPSVAERLVEEHSLLDTNGKLNSDPTTFQFLVQRDNFKVPTTKDNVPLESGATLTVGYFPDPLARGAALRNLPNTPSDTNGRIGKSGLNYATLPDVDARPGSVTYIDFGTQPWPDATAFRLVLVEGNAKPKWDANARVLTVYLQKASVVTVPLSCYLNPPDLDILGVWGWLRELFEALELNSLQTGGEFQFAVTSDNVAQVTRLVLEGGHPMITPALTLTLVHAVQQPLGEPTFLQLPVVHDQAAPIFASALRNDFTPITAWRSVESHEAVLLGGLEINGASSSKVELKARWLEVTDDPSLPAPTQSVASQLVETFELQTLIAGPIYSDAHQTRMVAVYIPQVDVLWFSGPQDTLSGVNNPSNTVPAAPIHRFNDTRHRWIEYTPVATSRFEEYFPTGLDFTRSGPMLVVDVPSSARPSPPDIAYVVPTFGWERQETSNVKSTVRYGSGLRVYLNRGWYSSGQDELLGVILWSPSAEPTLNPPTYQTRELYKGLFTQWGCDPIWDNGDLSVNPVPAIGNFPNAVETAFGLTIPESTLKFDVAGHQVVYDSGRGLWYCDIQVGDLLNYAPFIRLALARYQTHSISGVELSPVALADFAQLTPDRSAVLSINPANPKVARLFVGGLAPIGPLSSVLQVSVETRALNVSSDLDWKPAPASAVTVTEDAGEPVEPNTILWSGNIVFAKTPPRGQFRVKIQEYETYPADASSGKITDPPTQAQRLIYAAILAYDYP